MSKLEEPEVKELLSRLYEQVTFINDELIPFEEYIIALRLVRDIDTDDVAFVALSNYLNKTLWTGDMKLYTGLKQMGYTNVVNFEELKRKYNA